MQEIERFEDEVEDTTKGLGDFGTMASVAGGMIAAELVGSIKNVTVESVQLAAQMEPLRSAFKAMTAGVDESVISLDSLRAAVGGTVSDIDLLKAANQAMALGLPTEDLNELFEAAKKVGQAMGLTTTQAIESLTTGLGRQSKLILDNLGIVVDTDKAYRDYAESIGKTVSALTDSERKLAFQATAMEELRRKAEELGDSQNELTDTLQVWNATVENTKVRLGEFAGASIVVWSRFGRAVMRAMEEGGEAITQFEAEYRGLRESHSTETMDMIEQSQEMKLNLAADLSAVAQGFKDVKDAADSSLEGLSEDVAAANDEIRNMATLLEGVQKNLSLMEAEVVGLTGVERAEAERAERAVPEILAERTIYGRELLTGVTRETNRSETNVSITMPVNIRQVNASDRADVETMMNMMLERLREELRKTR